MKRDNINKISLGTTYYNNPELIVPFIKKHLEYVDELLIVDDGSDEPNHIYNFVSPSEKIKLFRVTKDYGFNSHGCRNLIMTKASNEFVILLDSDREFVNPQQIEDLKRKRLSLSTLYHFTVIANSLVKHNHVSVNDYLISKNFFFSAGGYDEEWIGLRNGDRQYFQQLMHFGKKEHLADIFIQFTRVSTLRISDNAEIKSPNDTNKIDPKKIETVYRRIKYPEPNKKILTFDWEEIT